MVVSCPYPLGLFCVAIVKYVVLECIPTEDWLYLARIYLYSLKYITRVNVMIYYSLLTFSISIFMFAR